MWFVILGVVIIGLNLADIGPFGAWTWNITGDLWKFCVPFALAVVWWIWADKSGLDKRALDAYRRALDLYPQQPDIRKSVEKLQIDVEGRDI